MSRVLSSVAAGALTSLTVYYIAFARLQQDTKELTASVRFEIEDIETNSVG
jgi:hypothetical protein